MTDPCVFQSDGYNQLTAGKDGYFLYNKNDIYIGGSLKQYGEYSSVEMRLFSQICTPGHVVIEVGANVGVHTVGLARLVGQAGRVLAFEPQRLVFQTLCANIALNSLDNVECYWAAAGDEHGAMTVPELLPQFENNFGGLSLGSAPKGTRVPCIMLDDFAALSRLDLVKIDVEGMEAKVIRGGETLLRRLKPTLYVENDRCENSTALIELIASLGYRLYWHLPPLYDEQNFRGSSENIFPGVVSCNMLCVHRDFDRQVAGIPEILDPLFHPFNKR